MIAALNRTDLALVRRLLGEARPYWPHLGAILLLDLLATPLVLLTPLPLKIAVDSVIGGAPLPGFLEAVVPAAARESPLALLTLTVALQVAILALVQVRVLGWYMLRARAGEGLTLAFRARLFRHAQRLSLAFHDRRGTADSIFRIQWEAPSIHWLTIDGLIPFVSAAAMLGGTVYVIAWLDPTLAVVALTVAPLLFVLSRLYDRRTRKRYREVKELETHALGIVQEVLGALRVVKAFGREETEQARFIHTSSVGARARVRLSLAEATFGLVINLTTALGAAAVLFMGIRSVLAGTLTLGVLLMVVAYLSQLYRPLETISSQVATLQESLASVRRGFELLDHPAEVTERAHARPLHRAAGTVEFQRVTFAYDDGRPVLRDVSFRVERGARVAIVGPSGAGKTTLLSLLTRFYDPTEGRILLDGVDLREYRLADLRNQFGIVLQDTILFSTTIRENIAYGRSDATSEAIAAAARAANAHDFIAGLSDSYDTVVGERGMQLSGGQRQRVALARAFLKNAPILILDEPTSSIDLESEAVIVDAMQRVMRGRTTFVSAHRASTLGICDTVLLVQDGHVVGPMPGGPAAIRALMPVAATGRTAGILTGSRRTGAA